VTTTPPLYPPRTGRLAAVAAAVLGFATAVSGGCSAQTGGGITHEQGDAILSELREIRRELAEEQKNLKAANEDPALPSGSVQISDNARQAMGAATAPVTLVEFTDYQCPFCKRFHERSWPEIKSKYVDTGKVRYIVRDMPLSFHGQAMPAAIAAECAGQQGQFWPVHEALFNGQESLSPEMIKKTAAKFGVASEAFERCIADPRIKAGVTADIAEAEKIGVNGTPGFVLGARHGDKIEGTMILGAQPTNVFSSRIDALLKAAPAAPAAP
jgi:protein-disulfide isomerase